jgi:hypothetical protein
MQSTITRLLELLGVRRAGDDHAAKPLEHGALSNLFDTMVRQQRQTLRRRLDHYDPDDLRFRDF